MKTSFYSFNVVLTLAVGWLLFPESALAARCDCKFDTSTYTSFAEGTGSCSQTTKQGKHCQISYNGNATRRYSPQELYGDIATPNEYRQRLSDANRAVSEGLINREPKVFVQRFLPLLIRASYVTAPFIEPSARTQLDTDLRQILEREPERIGRILTGESPPASFGSGRLKMNFRRGVVNMVLDDIEVFFSMDTGKIE